MRNTIRVIGLLVAAILLVAGCRTAMVKDVIDAPVVASAQKQPSAEDVQKAIQRAGAALGWRITPVKPGQLEGVLSLRTHAAVVNITYDASKYSIRYKDSTNLDYDGKQIHSNYNGWIENLDKGIRTQLLNL